MQKVLVAVPSNTGRQSYPTPFVQSIFAALQYYEDNRYGLDMDYKLELKNYGGLRLDAIRQKICHEVLRDGYEAVIMLDDDMSFPDEFFFKMLMHLKKGLMVVSGLYCQKAYPFQFFYTSTVEGGICSTSWHHNYPPNQVLETDNIGAGCVMIRAEALKKLAQPWFLLRFDLTGDYSTTEDCYFAQNCKLNGILMVIDTSLLCQHWGLAKFPGLFDHPYITHKLKLTPEDGAGVITNLDMEANVRVVKSNGIPSTPMSGMYWQDGVDVCGHEYIMINETQCKCHKCGIIKKIDFVRGTEETNINGDNQ